MEQARAPRAAAADVLEELIAFALDAGLAGLLVVARTDKSPVGDTQARLERQRWAIATVRRRRRQATAAIISLLALVPALVWITDRLPARLSGPALLSAFVLTAAGCWWFIFRASRCPVCSAQHAEGGHGVFDTLRYRAGQPQIGRTPGFTCSSCGTRLT